MNITEQLIKDFDFKPFQVENTLALFDEQLYLLLPDIVKRGLVL
jgi:hypothetical protein